MSKDFIFELQQKLKNKKVINDEVIEFIETGYPKKSDKVLDVIRKGITKIIYKPSNRIVWVALGENCEHIIYPSFFCSCQDFYKNVVVKKKRNICKHILAQCICEVLHKFQTLVLEDEEFEKLISDLELKF